MPKAKERQIIETYDTGGEEAFMDIFAEIIAKSIFEERMNAMKIMERHPAAETQKRIRTLKYLEAAMKAAGYPNARLKLHEKEHAEDVVKFWQDYQGNTQQPDTVICIEADSAIAMLADVVTRSFRLFY